MSVETPPDPESYVCDRCEDSFDPAEAVKGSFCSPDCYYRYRGQGALEQIESDHRLCATCFAPVRDILPKEDRVSPIRSPPSCAIGLQFPTEYTQWAETEYDSISPTEHDGPLEVIGTAWACSCGATDLSVRDDIIEEVELEAIISRLFWCLSSLAETDALAQDPEREAYFDGLRRHWRDWEYAAGRALYTNTDTDTDADTPPDLDA